MVLAIEPGSWAETEGLQLGDQLLAIGGVAVDRWVAAQPPKSGFTVMGPQRVVVRFQAMQEDVRQAFRSVSETAEQRERFRAALKDEAQRFEFREQLQGQLRSWRPRELWPFPGLPPKAVDASVELQQLTQREGMSQSKGRGRQPRIKEMDAAARKLQALFRWRKLWTQLDTSQEREAAAKKIQAMHRGNQVRRGLAAQFAAVHHVEVLPPSNATAEVVMSKSEEVPLDPVPQHLDPPDFGRTISPFAEPIEPRRSPRNSGTEGTVHLHVASPAAASPPSSALMGFFDAPDPQLEAAAVRIQAMERGRQERKKFKALKTEKVEQFAEEADVPPAPTASFFSLGPTEVAEEVADASPVEAMPLDPMSFMGTQAPMEAPIELEEKMEAGEGLEPATSEVEDAEATLLSPPAHEQPHQQPTLDVPEAQVAPPPEDASVSAAAEVSAAPSFDPMPRAKLEIGKAPVKSKGFRMAPVNFGSAERTQESKMDSPRSPGWQGSNQSDGLPDNTLDFIDDTPSSQLVPQSQLRLKLPKAKKSPRAKVERVEPLIKPTMAAASSAGTVKPEESAAWLAGPELQGPGPSASSDLLGPSPGPGASLVSGFRLPKGDRSKEERDESKGKKKKKKKKEKKEDDLDNFGFDIF